MGKKHLHHQHHEHHIHDHHDEAADMEKAEKQPLLPKSMTMLVRATGQFMSSIKIPCRAEPRLDAERTGHIVNPGEVVTAHRIVTVVNGELVEWENVPVDDLCFIHLGEEIGWVMNRNPVTNAIIFDPLFDEDANSSSAKVRFDLRAFFGTKTYELMTTAVIVVNGLFIWSEIDYPTRFNYTIINLLFSIVYCIEIGTKMFAFGTYFFYSNWNVFDFTVTGITILTDFAEYVVDGQTAKNMRTLAPVIRLLRLLRLTNMFAGLKALMRSFVTSLGSLGWVALFIAVWFFICACLMTILIGRKDFFPDTATVDPADAQRLRGKFDTVPHSMYTLFEVMSMEGWAGVVRPLVAMHPFLVFFFFVFIFVSGFFLLNLVTAIVVDRTVQAQEEGEEAAKACDNDDVEVDIFELMKQFKASNNGEDVIARDALSVLLKEHDTMERLLKFGWHAETLEDVTAMLDKNLEGSVSLEGLQHVISSASREIDMMSVIRVQAAMTRRLERNEELIRKIAEMA